MTFGDPWTTEQQKLGALVYQVWSRATPARWPSFFYVEMELYRRHRLNAAEVLASFPVVGQVGAGHLHYADVSYDRRGHAPESTVKLTVAGVSRAVVEGQDLARIFVAVLGCAGELLSHAAIDPYVVSRILLTSQSVASSLVIHSPEVVVPALYDMLTSEPPTVTGLTPHTQDSDDGSWAVGVTPYAFRHVSGTTVAEYLKAVVEELTPPPEPQPRVLPSPLALLEALHYIDITWQRHCSRPLVQVSDPAATATLAFDVATQDEFAARTNALADLLKSLQTHSAPGVDGHALKRLGAYLKANLEDSGDQAALDPVLRTLENVVDVRNAVHAAAAGKGANALIALGVVYPPTDWNDTWLRVRSAATHALMDLRPFVERLPVAGLRRTRELPGYVRAWR